MASLTFTSLSLSGTKNGIHTGITTFHITKSTFDIRFDVNAEHSLRRDSYGDGTTDITVSQL
jgi:hypothetical protein